MIFSSIIVGRGIICIIINKLFLSMEKYNTFINKLKKLIYNNQI